MTYAPDEATHQGVADRGAEESHGRIPTWVWVTFGRAGHLLLFNHRNEELLWVSDATPRAADPEERKKLHRLGDEPAIATLAAEDGETVAVAAAPDQASALLGPFARAPARETGTVSR